jgi:O-antigen/teichoic acid export membrane protein
MNLYNKHRETIHNFFWRSLQIFSKHGVAFLIFFIAAKLLRPEDFGLLNYLRAVVALLIIFCDFGLSQAVSKFAAEYQTLQSEKLNRLLFSVLTLIVAIATLISIVIISIGGRIFKENYRYIVLLLPYLFLMPLTSVIDGLYRGLKQFKKLALISSIVGAFSLFICYVLINRFYLVGAILAQNTMPLLLVLSLYAFQKKFRFEFDKSVLGDVFKYALVLGIGVLAYFFYTRVDILILKQFGFLVEIGYYGIVNNIFLMLFVPFAILGQ